jgi:dipeptidase E
MRLLLTGTPLCEVGWKSLGVLELTALPSLDEEFVGWQPPVGGDEALGLVDGSVEVVSEGNWRLFES